MTDQEFDLFVKEAEKFDRDFDQRIADIDCHIAKMKKYDKIQKEFKDLHNWRITHGIFAG